MTKDYIKALRKKVGHEPIILNFAGGILANDQNKILLQIGVSTNFIQRYPNQDVAQAVTIEFVVELVEKTSKEVSSETLDLKYFSKNKLPKIFNKQHQLFIYHYFDKDYPFIN